MDIKSYDKKTISHIQKVVGAPQTGEFNLQTLQKLSEWYTSGKTTKNFRPDSSTYCSATIADIQKTVGTTPDGLWGPKTIRKISDWYLSKLNVLKQFFKIFNR